MKKQSSLLIVLLLLISWQMQAQRKTRQPVPGPKPHYELKDLHLNNFLPAVPRVGNVFASKTQAPRQPLSFNFAGGALKNAKVSRDPQTGLPIAIEGSVAYSPVEAPGRNTLLASCYGYLAAIKGEIRISNPEQEFVLSRIDEDDKGFTHVRMTQQYLGLPVYGAEILLHFKDGKIYYFNGRYQATPALETTQASISEQNALSRCEAAWGVKSPAYHANSETNAAIVAGTASNSELVVYGSEQGARLAWKVQLRPHALAAQMFFVDALSGEILHQRNEVCQITGTKPLNGHQHANDCSQSDPNDMTMPPPPDGPATANATDLFGQSQTVNSYIKSNVYYLIDASRTMFNAGQSTFPNDAVGVIWTINAQNTSPENDNFNTVHITSNNNTWSNANGVSAHVNAGRAFTYFKQTFNRNSINGQGGNIISLINVSEPNGQPLDNAYWNGAAMFYGNGSQAFSSPLAKSLDVAGHEMSHGVIQNTANLEYYGESGAINESFADVFGAMIDRNDWLIGEDIVNDNIFASGALRNLQDPHNGGNSLNDNGYQPAHYNEKYNGGEDNGGVHINSGIPNKAFYLFANQVGKDVAEQVYYRALNNYLTRSSQFIDLRNAVIQAATDLQGANSAAVTAAANAFSAVGIGAGQGGDYTEDVNDNPGEEFILFTDSNQNQLFVVTPNGDIVFNPLTTVGPISKPSVTDDGSIVVYIASDHTMRGVIINWQQGNAQAITVSDDPIWDNVAISKDGNRIAALTNEEDNRIYVFDLVSEQAAEFELYNPTYAEDVETGDVAYADVLEWDFSGQQVMYDALNRINNSNGDVEYWDIGFISVWNNDINDFGDGFISKLFSGLPENTGVGDPTFSKNSPYIIALDYFSTYFDEYYVVGVNLETNDISTIFENSDLGYPSYSTDDNYLIFDAFDNFGNDIIAYTELESDKITPAGNAFILLNPTIGAHWGVWFANGDRVLTDADNIVLQDATKAYPNPFHHNVNIVLPESITGNRQITICDALGKTVYQMAKEISANTPLALELAQLPAGQYWLSVEGLAKPVSIVKMP